jgi:hypothetical protein
LVRQHTNEIGFDRLGIEGLREAINKDDVDNIITEMTFALYSLLIVLVEWQQRRNMVHDLEHIAVGCKVRMRSGAVFYWVATTTECQ